MQAYLSNYAIPIIANWSGQFFICKAIIYQLLFNNKIISLFVIAFLLIMDSFYVSLNGRKLVFIKNLFLFNDIYKRIFGKNKDLSKKLCPWQMNLMLHIMHII